jgi:hypothetical protein
MKIIKSKIKEIKGSVNLCCECGFNTFELDRQIFNNKKRLFIYCTNCKTNLEIK